MSAVEAKVLSFSQHTAEGAVANMREDTLAQGVLISDDMEMPQDRTHTVSRQRATSGSIEELMSPLRQYLNDSRVMELAINRPGELCIETAKGWVLIDCPEMSFDRCLSLAGAIATNTEQTINEKNPLLSATLHTDERVQIVIPPTVEAGLVSYTFRKPSKTIWTLDDFEKQGLFKNADASSQKHLSDTWTETPTIKECGVKLYVDEPAEVRDNLHLLEPFEVKLLTYLWEGRIAEFLRGAVLNRRNMAVSGATGSGKTTFMKGVMQECSRTERLVSIEDARELFLPNHPNKVHLLYSKGGQGVAAVTASKLLVSCLRMKPDRILLAEIREGECYDFLRVAASGHPGSITSLHAGTCLEAFEQMGLMIRQSEAGAGLAHAETQRLLRMLLDTLVQYKKEGGRRRVAEIYYRPLLKQQTVGN